MEKRRLGRTDHMSTVAIFGAAAFFDTTPGVVEDTMELVTAAGINHIDVAPGYGMAEKLIGPWIERERERIFLGCKTQLREKGAAAAELGRSLDLLRTDRFDLFQIHAVTSTEELDQVMSPTGSLDAIIEARDEGLTKFIGITGHGAEAPAVFIEALHRFDFDTVMFPLNFIQYANPVYREKAEELLDLCKQRDVGTMIIKAVAKGPWGDKPKRYNSWYEPFDDSKMIDKAVDFALSQPVSGLCTTADVNILSLFIAACENFKPMEVAEQEMLVAEGLQYEPLFA